jgi:hypothetical protein
MAEAAEEWPIRNVEIVDDHWVDLTIDFGDGITTIYRIAREG